MSSASDSQIHNIDDDFVVDLTGSDDQPVNPLRQPPTPRRRRRRLRPASNPDGSQSDDSDIEIVNVTQGPMRKRRRLSQTSSDGVDIVEEQRLTPQERLRRIQEQHARGEVVRSNQPAEPEPYYAYSGFNAFQGPGPRVMAPHAFHPYLMPGRNRRFAFDIMAHQYPHLFPGLADGSRLEQSIIDRTIQNSMNETYHEKRLTVDQLIRPQPPAAPRSGFVRSLATDDELVCVKCGATLGKPQEGLTGTALARSAKVFVRGCGHVYCGQCVFAMKDRANKDKKCPVEDCKIKSAKKRGLFREVFL